MRLLLFLFFAMTLALGTFFLALGTSPGPEVEQAAVVDLAAMERGRLIVETLDLTHIQEGETRHLEFTEQDIALVLGWVASNLGRAGADVRIDGHSLQARLSLRIEGMRRYLNFVLVFRPKGEVLQPAALRLGKLPLPIQLSRDLLDRLLAISPAAEQYKVARSMLQRASLGPGQLAVDLVWRGKAMQKAMQNVSWNPTEADTTDLEPYRAHLATIDSHDHAVLLGAAFALARDRTQAGGDPIRENRSALTVLAEAALGGRLFAGKHDQAPRHQGGASLSGRQDSAQHFAISAFIALYGGKGISDLAGLYKEIHDTTRGSGFSFTDLAADRAGTRLAELATRSPADARRVQTRLAGCRDERVFFPKIKDLPEYMGQAEFQQRFGGVGAPEYQKEVEEIDTRIANLPVYWAR
jgi:hypothetical protein